jgi:hypothetical protein
MTFKERISLLLPCAKFFQGSDDLYLNHVNDKCKYDEDSQK